MSATSRFAALPHAFLGMLALVLGCELMLARQWMSLIHVQPAVFRFAARAAQKQAVHCEILCFGDSLVKLGLVPRLLEAELNRPAYNLAVIAGQSPSTYFLLRRALAAGAHPNAIVVNFKDTFLAVSPWVNVRQWSEVGSLRDCLEFAWRAPNTLCGTMLADWLLPSFHFRDELRSRVLDALADRKRTTPPEAVWHWHNWVANRGAQLMPKNPITDPNLLVKSDYYPYNWFCDPVNAHYLRQFLKLAQAHNITVFWLLAPTQPCVQIEREESGLDELYMKMVRKALAKYSNVVIIDGRHSGYEANVFIDYSHLDRDGASALTSGVAAVMRDYLSNLRRDGSRIAALPGYTESKTRARLVDLEQSRLALGNRN